MKEITIAFDIDGTILSNEDIPAGTPAYLRPATPVNLEVIMLIQILSKMKNTRIIMWSGGGKDYAEMIRHRYGLEKFVSKCFAKADYNYERDGKVDICFDDVHDCQLAEKNIIVKMK